MKILFITIGGFKKLDQSGIYIDLVRMFRNKGHKVYVICSRERREKKETDLCKENGIHVLRVKTGNLTKSSFFEKGIATLLLGIQFQKSFDKYFGNISFDCILYSTPPVTIASMVRNIKDKTGAFTYLMLKDIFPQNAVDLGVIKKTGITGVLYWYFRYKEKQLYRCSDKIGCMSPANVEYILSHNTEIEKSKVEVCPNTNDLIDIRESAESDLYEKYHIPKDRLILTYGGNFGRPQNIDFVVRVLKNFKGNKNVHFIMCGAGTEFYKIQKESQKNNNITCISQLPYREYIQLLKASNIGMIFLDERFTIPNFPSRLLDYLNFQLPVFMSTDEHTDIGRIIEENECGWWIKGNDEKAFVMKIVEIVKKNEQDPQYIKDMGMKARRLLEEKYTTRSAYEIIMESYSKKRFHVRKMFQNRILYIDRKMRIEYAKGKICFIDLVKHTHAVYVINKSLIKRILAQFRLTERLLRLEPRAVLKKSEDIYILSHDGKMYQIDLEKQTFTCIFTYAAGTKNPLYFCQYTRKGDNEIVFGDYGGHDSNGNVGIYCLKDEQVREIAMIDKRFIEHIHRVEYDKYRDCFWILTGDRDEASGFWRLQYGENSAKPFLLGKQKYRSCVFFVNRENIIYATDAPNEKNAVYLLNIENKKTEKIKDLPGTCIFGKEFGDGEEFCLATAVEPDTSLTGWRYLITRRLGRGIEDFDCHLFVGSEKYGFSEVWKARKDNYPMLLFQFGNIRFPVQNFRDKVFFCPQSCEKEKGTYVIERC